MLLLVFLVQPICLLVAIFQSLFCWIFVGLSFVLLLAMWGMQCFAFKPRLLTSIGMVVLILFTLTLGIIKSAPKDPTFQPLGGDTPGIAANPPWGSGEGGDPAAYGAVATDPLPQSSPTPRNPAFIGLGASQPTAPIEAAATPAAPVTDTSMAVTGGIIVDTNRAFNEAETVLNNYMQMWSDMSWEDMVQYTSPTWRGTVNIPPFRQLFYNHSGWSLLNWTIQADAQTPGVEAVTLSVVATLTKNGNSTEIVQQYAAILYQVEGVWYVDPDSMRNGMAVATAAPTANPAGAQPNATTSANIDPATKLWRNSKGGEYYHAEEHCIEVAEKYWENMVSFEYAELDASDYKNLKRCPVCNAPARP
jgi:hypothetical protein